MRTFLSSLALAAALCCQGATDLNTIAATDWSAAVESAAGGLGGSLRARLIILEGNLPASQRNLPETLVFLELQNVGHRDLEIYCDFQKGLQCELRDSSNNPPPPVGTGGDGGYPGPCWVILPRDATIRLRASWFGYGMPKEKGLIIPLFSPLILDATNPKEYWLSGSFAVSPPESHSADKDRSVWTGRLTLPAVKISAKRS